MKVEPFYQSRIKDWETLEVLVARGNRGLQALSPAEVRQLGWLYRAATSDLALAQRDFPRHPVASQLNQLVARAHAVIYQSEAMAGARLWRFARWGFPRAYRRALPFIAAAAALLLLPGTLAGVVTNWRPESAEWLLPGQVLLLQEHMEDGELWTSIPVQDRPYAASFIMGNNIQVAILAFGGGILAGLLTVWMLVLNGLILGGITGLTAHYELGFELWTFVIGHGVIELSVICIAGGAGLRVGWSILRPGFWRRRDALAHAAREAVTLILGCIPLLVLAGTIEGFISPAENLEWPIKWAIGLGSGVLLYAYLLLAGRGSRTRGDLEAHTPLKLEISIDDRG